MVRWDPNDRPGNAQVTPPPAPAAMMQPAAAPPPAAPAQPPAGAAPAAQAAPAPAAPAAPAGGAPAQTSAQPSARQAFADMNALVERNVNGKKEIIPVSVAVADAAKFAAGTNILEEAKRYRQENAQITSDAEAWRNFQANIARNPAGAVQAVQRLANLANGAPVQVPVQPSQPAGSQLPSNADDGEVDPKTRELDERMRRLESREHQAAIERDVDTALAQYPLLTANEEIANASRLMLMAARQTNPNAPLDRVAALLHTGVVQAAGGVATETRDRRAAAVASTPHVPVTGTPELQSPPKPGRNALRDGSFERDMAQMFDKMVRAPLGH